MKYVNLLVCLIMLLVIGCTSNYKGKTEKFQKHRDKIMNVGDKIIDIKTEILFGNPSLNIVDDILIVTEIKPSGDKGIHLFNKNTFKYITSTGIIGKGPGEVTRQGQIVVDSKNRVLWVADHGKMVLWQFPLDSILNNAMYKPTKKRSLHKELFIERFDFLNDSIALGKAVRVLSNSSFEMAMAKLNLNTNITEVYGYEHPEAVGKRSNSKFKLSIENNIYVNCYCYCDLMTICDLNGNLKYNIYGPNKLDNRGDKNFYFSDVDMINDKIIASYISDIGIIFNEFKRPQGNLPSKFLIFDLDGNYIETIETGSKFTFFCVDKENNRVIAYFADRVNPLGYFNLNLN